MGNGSRLGLSLGFALVGLSCGSSDPSDPACGSPPDGSEVDGKSLIDQGRHTFRYDTFGDEAYWGDTLHLNQAIAGDANGGVGDGVSPTAALTVGLKVDQDALSDSLITGLKNGTVDLDDPASTLALLKANAVVGLTGRFDQAGTLTSIGIQCALCHSTVDDALAPGIGHRLDGWANRDLDIGTIIALAPDLSVPAGLLGVDQDTLRTVLHGWGPGRFDAEVFVDGKALGPDGVPHPTLIPPAFGLAGVNLHTWTGWGSVPYWNAFVAVLEMHGQGNFFDPRLDDAARFPIAAANGLGHIDVPVGQDRVTPKLPGLHVYQLSLAAPNPPPGSFDQAAARRGKQLFDGKAACSTCHTGPQRTDPGWNLHTAAELGIDDFQAERSPAGGYRTAPLAGLFTHQKGGFYHDGRFATLDDVIDHYDEQFGLGLSAAERQDLVQYLLSQ